MNNFSEIKKALEYIDAHLDEPITLKSISDRFHFSLYYFHRMFSVIVGKPIAAYIRDRRLQYACIQLSSTDKSILNIGLDCGYGSAQSFSRTFRQLYGLSPSAYRKAGFKPYIISVDEMIMKFTNRLRGGIFLNPDIMNRDVLLIAGVSGDGNKTGDVWNAFELLSKEKPLVSQRPRSKLQDIKPVCAASCGAFDPRGIRQMQEKNVPALGSLLAGIKYLTMGMKSGCTMVTSALFMWDLQFQVSKLILLILCFSCLLRNTLPLMYMFKRGMTVKTALWMNGSTRIRKVIQKDCLTVRTIVSSIMTNASAAVKQVLLLKFGFPLKRINHRADALWFIHCLFYAV